MGLGGDDELSELLQNCGLSAKQARNSEVLQERPHVRCLVQLCADLRCRVNPDALNSDYHNDGGMTGAAFKLLGGDEQKAYLQGLQDAICCSYSLRAPGGLGTVDQMLSYRDLKGAASIKAHSHVLLMLSQAAQENSAEVADLVEDNLIKQHAIAEKQRGRNQGLSKLRRTQACLPEIKPYDGPGTSHKLVSATSCPAILPAAVAHKKPEAIKNQATSRLSELPNRRPAQISEAEKRAKKKEGKEKDKKALENTASIFTLYGPAPKRALLSEGEEQQHLDRLKISSRNFFQTEVNWRTDQDLADLNGNHNACMRSFGRQKALMEGTFQVSEQSTKSRSSLLGSTGSKSLQVHKESHKHPIEAPQTSQAIAIRELSWTLFPELKPKSKKQELMDSVAQDLKALMKIGPGPSTQETQPGPAGDAEPCVNEFSKFVEEKFNADIHRVFKALDSNGNGQLTVNELLVSMTTLRFLNEAIPGRRTEDVKHLFKMMDANHGGDISLKEFKNTFGERLAARQRAMQQGDANSHPGVVEMVYFLQEKMGGDLPAAFKDFDQNNNGGVSEKEWLAALEHPIKYINPKIPGRGVQDCIEVFQAIDISGGGNISLKEFKEFFGPKLKERMRKLHGDDAVNESAPLDRDLMENIRHGLRKADQLHRSTFVGSAVTLHKLPTMGEITN